MAIPGRTHRGFTSQARDKLTSHAEGSMARPFAAWRVRGSTVPTVYWSYACQTGCWARSEVL